MDVWLVTDATKVSTTILAILAYEPTEAELGALGPLRQDFSSATDPQGHPYTTRVITKMTVQGRSGCGT